MGRQKKSQKKFASKHLAGEIKKRRFNQKVQRSQQKRYKDDDADEAPANDNTLRNEKRQKSKQTQSPIDPSDFTEDAFIKEINDVSDNDYETDNDDNESLASLEGLAPAKMGGVDDTVRTKNELKQHKHYMQKMKESDPEFFNYLIKNDPDLLEFGGDVSSGDDDDDADDGADVDVGDVDGDDIGDADGFFDGDDDGDGGDDGDDDDGDDDDGDDDVDDDGDDDDDDDADAIQDLKQKQKPARPQKQKKMEVDDDAVADDDDMADNQEEPVNRLAERPILPLTTAKEWQKQLLANPTPTAIRKMILAFRAACDMSSAKSNQDDKSKDKKDKHDKKDKKEKKTEERKRRASNPPPIQVTDSKVFVFVWHCCTTDLPAIFDKTLGIDTSSSSLEHIPASSPKWKTTEQLVKRYLTQLADFLADMDVSENDMQCYVLRHLARMAPYAVCHTSVAKRIVKGLLRVWGSGLSEDCRLAAFLAMRRMCLCSPVPFLELCLKGMYLTFARITKTMTIRTMGIVQVMRNSIVELCGIDSVFAYVHAFTYLRQLAIHLRNALAVKTKDAYKLVYNWPYIACLEVWVSVVCAYPTDPELSALLYPVSQILMGTVRVLPTARYFPLRLHCCRMMTALCISTKKFIPLSPVLLEILDSSDLHKKAIGKKTARFEFRVNLKVSKVTTQCPSYQDGLVSEVLFCLLEFFASFASSISFPELVLPTMICLRKHAKLTQVTRFRRQMQTVIEQLREQSQWIENLRNKMDIGPAKVDECLDFLAGDQGKVAASPLIRHYTNTKKARDRELQAIDRDHKSKGDDDEAGIDSDDSDDPHAPQVPQKQAPAKQAPKQANKQAPKPQKSKSGNTEAFFQNPDVVEDLDIEGF